MKMPTTRAHRKARDNLRTRRTISFKSLNRIVSHEHDDGNDNEDLYSPEAFAMAAWGLLTITVEKLKELDPEFDKRAIKLYDHLLGKPGNDPEYQTIKEEARKIFEQVVRRDLAENRIAWRRFTNRLRGTRE